jgi:hypothetical protein
MKYHVGPTKYSRIYNSLPAAGFLFVVVFQYFYPTMPERVPGIGYFFILVGLVVHLAGWIGERRAREDKIDTKSWDPECQNAEII